MNKNIEDNSGTKKLAIESSVETPEFLNTLTAKSQGFKLVYYMWLSRLFIATSIFSLFIMLSTSLSLFKLAPTVTVEPLLMINQHASKNLVRDEPISFDMVSKEKLMETFIRQYVILRNTMISDPIEMRSRWMPGGMLHLLSSDEIFKPFFVVMKKQWKGMFESKMTREVEIISIGKQGGEKSKIWKVDFKTYDMYETRGNRSGLTNIVLRTRYWTASVTDRFIPGRNFLSYRLINPLGFTVLRYSQTEVELY